jgi:probable phosphoglycerate mutase
MELPLGKDFYMLRHAQTEDNVNKLVSGSGSSTNLTETGKKQALEMQQLICKLDPKSDPAIDRIITSEMQRTKDTASIICGCKTLEKLPISVDSGLNERSYGKAEGMSDKERSELKKSGAVIEGEESKEDVAKRTLQAIIRNLESGSGVPLFISHGGNIRRVVEAVLGVDFVEKTSEYITNCTLYEFIAAKIKGQMGKVNIISLGENKKIHRRAFGEQLLESGL